MAIISCISRSRRLFTVIFYDYIDEGASFWMCVASANNSHLLDSHVKKEKKNEYVVI